MKLRRAQIDDVEQILAIRTEFSPSQDTWSSAREGFLLGNDADGYRKRIENGIVWVLEDLSKSTLGGFCILLPDEMLRASEFWMKRAQIQWAESFKVDENARVGYFDQLAVLPSCRAHAVRLAKTGVSEMMADGTDFMVATTVTEPMINRAATPLLRRVGAQPVGTVHEYYPSFGSLVSTVWVLTRANFERWLTSSKFAGGQRERR